MHSRYRNVGTEEIYMYYWTIILIKVNDLDLRTIFYTVSCNKFPCIRTVVYLCIRRNRGSEKILHLVYNKLVWDLKEVLHYRSCHNVKIKLLSKLALRTFDIFSNVIGCLIIVWETNFYMG